jgi:hypothetical protein
MPPSTERQLARLKARYHLKARELADVGFMMKGSIVERFLTCGSPGCHCHTDASQRHGPYWQLNDRRNGKAFTRFLAPGQLARFTEWSENSKRFEEIVSEMLDISRQTDEILAEQERGTTASPQKPTTKSAAQRRAARIL